MEGTDTAGNTIIHSFNTESVKPNTKKNGETVSISLEESLAQPMPKAVNSLSSHQQSKTLVPGQDPNTEDYRGVILLTNGQNLEDIAPGSTEPAAAGTSGIHATKSPRAPAQIDFTNLTSWNHPDEVPQVADVSSPLRNSSILQHTTILQQQKYQLLLDREQMLVQMNRQRNRMEQERIHRQILESDSAHITNKKVWRSPFAFRQTN